MTMNTLTITEVLPEPGSTQLWVTFSDDRTHRVDLELLLRLPEYRALGLNRLFGRVKVSADQLALEWPGGARVNSQAILATPVGWLPLLTVAALPAAERYRPLLPYLRHLDLPIYLHPDPIEASTVIKVLRLKPGELDTACRNLRAPEALVYARLYDVGVFLEEHFLGADLSRLLRRPWRFGAEQSPGQPLLHTMLGCLTYGRPDLVERVGLTLLTGSGA